MAGIVLLRNLAADGLGVKTANPGKLRMRQGLLKEKPELKAGAASIVMRS